MGILDGIVGAVVGGLFDQQRQQDQQEYQSQINAQNFAMTDAQQGRQMAHDVEMAHRNQWFSREMHERNAAMQREFAQMGIRWKVEDAQAAGLHPLYALGGGASFSPSAFIGGNASSLPSGHAAQAAADVGSSMGQNISRAIAAMETPEERVQRQLQAELTLSQVRLNHANAAALESQAAVSRQSQQPMVHTLHDGESLGIIEGSVLHDVTRAKPHELISRRSTATHITPGANPAFMEVDIGGGQTALVPYSNEGLAEAAEGMYNPAVLVPTIAANVRHATRRDERPFYSPVTDAMEFIWPVESDAPGPWERIRGALRRFGEFRPPLTSRSARARALERRLGIDRR